MSDGTGVVQTYTWIRTVRKHAWSTRAHLDGGTMGLMHEQSGPKLGFDHLAETRLHKLSYENSSVPRLPVFQVPET